MGLFGRSRREDRAEGGVQYDDSLLQALLGSGDVTRETALQVPTVSGGIDLIANLVAGTPIKLYRDTGGKAEEVRDDPRLRLLNDETGDTLNANEFWRAIIRDYYLGKGGYAYIHREKARWWASTMWTRERSPCSGLRTRFSRISIFWWKGVLTSPLIF